MIPLWARDALHVRLSRVAAEARPPPAVRGPEDTVYAVFEETPDATPGTRFRGLVTPREIALFPGRIFADLLPARRVEPVAPHTPLAEVRAHMDESRVEALPVMDDNDVLVGVVTRTSLLGALLEQEQAMVVEAQHLQAVLARDRDRLADSQAAAVELLALSATHSIETELLQRGIEILAKLIQARYGAIGILDETGRLAQFLYTGISAEDAGRIGALPTGRGLLGVVVRANQAMCLDDMRSHPNSVGFPRHHPPMKSLLAVPIARHGRAYGRVYLSDKISGEPFTEQDQRLAMAYANSLALVIANTKAATERVQIEGSLRESEECFRQMAESIDEVFWLGSVDLDQIYYISPRYEVVWGRSCDSLYAHPQEWSDAVHPDDRERVYRTLVESKGRVCFMEYRILRPDGAIRHIRSRAFPVRNQAGRVYRMAGTAEDITDRKTAQTALAESQQRLTEMVQEAADSIVFLDLSGNLLAVNPATERITGYAAIDLVGKHFARAGLLAPHALVVALKEFALVVAGEERPPVELDIRCKSGAHVTTEANPRLIRRAGKAAGVQVTLRDVTERKRAAAETARLSSAIQQTADSIFITDRRGIVEYVNPAFERVTGYSAAEVLGRSLAMLKSGQMDRAFYERLWQTLERGESFRDVFVNRRKDGQIYYEEKTITPLKDATGRVTNYVSTGRDITERLKTEERLAYLANYDTLTGLPNRVQLGERLRQAFAEADQRAHLVAVVFLDLDRFKMINDSLGREVGDALLRAVAGRLKDCVRPGDTVARLGGDEFVVAFADIAHMDDIARMVQKISGAFVRSFPAEGHDLFVTTSTGIAVYPSDDQGADALLKNAEVAMYHAKRRGPNHYEFYSAQMNAMAGDRLALENSLREALQRDEFLLHYQPQVELQAGKVIGAEVLARWQHPQRGMVPPARFIPLAEETGLIIPIGEWVLRTACAQARAWQDAGLAPLRIAINLAAHQFRQKRLVETVRGILDDTGLDAQYLELEITESAVMHDPDAAIATLRALRDLGVTFSLDDFGTGYSSLNHLKRFPIDTLKIDRSFVRDITSDPDDAAIASAIIAMAHSLGIQVVAEGVETPEQLTFLRNRGCDSIQGYHFCRPVAADAFQQLLHDDRRLALAPAVADVEHGTLLIVDDEHNVTAAIRRALCGQDYQILTAHSAKEGFDLLATRRVDVVLSDQRMPVMDGVEFLRRVKELYPGTVRMVLSGYSDLKSVTDAINHGAIYKFLSKPWDDDLLRANIREAFQLHAMTRREAECLRDAPRSAP